MASITNRALALILNALDKIFFPASEDDIESEAIEKKASGRDRERGGPSDEPERRNRDTDRPPESRGPGDYEERWMDGLEGSVGDNEQRSIENRMMLERIDFRTVWLMRIVVGVGIALLTRALVMDLGLVPA